ncbi:hypothetical protein [Sphingobacterium sp. UBA6320]|uniref:hypothetical protein n=1 Tax=Sphingobacterium sp. UBA6320 TaxID=1947510 RepID=UPI0025EA9DA9|nr:hypothetical protein [Sphingobacterium sp. UBA6320]
MPNSFLYDGSGSINDPLNYTIVTGTQNCPSPKQRICTINAEVQLIDGIERPVITGPLQAEITAANMTKQESENVRLRPN